MVESCFLPFPLLVKGKSIPCHVGILVGFEGDTMIKTGFVYINTPKHVFVLPDVRWLSMFCLACLVDLSFHQFFLLKSNAALS